MKKCSFIAIHQCSAKCSNGQQYCIQCSAMLTNHLKDRDQKSVINPRCFDNMRLVVNALIAVWHRAKKLIKGVYSDISCFSLSLLYVVVFSRITKLRELKMHSDYSDQ